MNPLDVLNSAFVKSAFGLGWRAQQSAAGASRLAGLLMAAVLAGCGTAGTDPATLAPVESPAGIDAAAAAAQRAAGAQGADAAKPGAGFGQPQSQVASVDLSGASGRAATGPGASSGAGGAGLDAMASFERVVYFDYDSFAIRDEFKPLLDRYARALAANKGKRLVIEGHTDERGGREYNLALGQKRAAAVVQSLTLLGATDGQLEAVSYGKERPAAAGASEDALARNRRAELKERS